MWWAFLYILLGGGDGKGDLVCEAFWEEWFSLQCMVNYITVIFILQLFIFMHFYDHFNLLVKKYIYVIFRYKGII